MNIEEIQNRFEIGYTMALYGTRENIHEQMNNDIKKLLIDKKALQEQLTLTDVVSGYFTSLDIGSKFEIIKNSSGHGFEIGETVTLEALMSADDDEYKFRGKKTYWWCGFAEVKKL